MEPIKGNVRCITIVHPLHEIRKYREFSGFFRWIGVFVCENIYGKEYGEVTDYYVEIPRGKDQDSAYSVCTVLKDMQQIFSANTISDLIKMAKIFENNELMRGSYAIAYFADAKKDYIYEQMTSARFHFQEALETLEQLEILDNSSRKYILAAKCNCKRRVNELYSIVSNALENAWYGWGDEAKRQKLREKLESKPCYKYEDINIDLNRILEETPNFYNAYAIRGFVSELDKGHRFDAAGEWLSVVNYLGSKSYVSYILYRLGKFCEARSTLGKEWVEKKWEYYELSWKTDERNYRSLYKLAVKMEGEGKLDKAEIMWEKLLEILGQKEDLAALQPIECAYLFKTYVNKGLLCIWKNEISLGVSFLKRAIEIYGNKYNEDEEEGFYPWMFGSEPVEGRMSWEIYKEAAREKLNIKHVYRILVKTAAASGMEALYNKYYLKLME